MGDDDTTTSADGKPIRVSGNLKKSYFAETVKNDGSKSGSKSSSKSSSDSGNESSSE